jgi:hypothetical protein
MDAAFTRRVGRIIDGFSRQTRYEYPPSLPKLALGRVPGRGDPQEAQNLAKGSPGEAHVVHQDLPGKDIWSKSQTHTSVAYKYRSAF